MALCLKCSQTSSNAAPQRSKGWKNMPICHITANQAVSLLLGWQCIQVKWLILCPFRKLEQQFSSTSMQWTHFGASCVVVVEAVAVIKILKWKCSFEQTEIIHCIILQLSTVWCDPVWPQPKPLQRRLHWNIYNALLLGGTCWENMPRDKLLHTAPPAASEIELMCCTSSDFQSSENIHGFHQI